MKTALIALILSVYAFSENFTEKQLARLKNKKEVSYEDLAHENPGCPENSICSEEMGKKMKKWSEFAKKMVKQKNAWSQLEKYRRKNGIPVSFLTTKESVLGIDPILHASRCERHNPKDKSKTVYKAKQFFRNDPRSESVNLDSVEVYEGPKRTSFKVPYEDAPLMIKHASLVVVQEHEDLFYYLSISKDGKWKVVDIAPKDLKMAAQTFENAECPEEEYAVGANHLKSYCKKIWNADSKKEQVVRLVWSCP